VFPWRGTTIIILGLESMSVLLYSLKIFFKVTDQFASLHQQHLPLYMYRIVKYYHDLLPKTTDSRFGHISIWNKQVFQAQVIFIFLTPVSDSRYFILETFFICSVKSFAIISIQSAQPLQIYLNIASFVFQNPTYSLLSWFPSTLASQLTTQAVVFWPLIKICPLNFHCYHS
jgi:hypothetical protein